MHGSESPLTQVRMFIWLGCELSPVSPSPQWSQIQVIKDKTAKPDTPVLQEMGLGVYQDKRRGKGSRAGNGDSLWCD